MIIDVHTHVFPRSVREDRAVLFSSEPFFEALYRAPDARCAGAVEGSFSLRWPTCSH